MNLSRYSFGSLINILQSPVLFIYLLALPSHFLVTPHRRVPTSLIKEAPHRRRPSPKKKFASRFGDRSLMGRIERSVTQSPVPRRTLVESVWLILNLYLKCGKFGWWPDFSFAKDVGRFVVRLSNSVVISGVCMLSMLFDDWLVR